MKKKDLECLYRKESGRYVPCSVCCTPDSIGNGIWYVKHRKGSTSITSVEYIGELLKVGDADDISMSTQCALDDIANEIMTSKEFGEMRANGCTLSELVHFVVKKCYDKSEK